MLPVTATPTGSDVGKMHFKGCAKQGFQYNPLIGFTFLESFGMRSTGFCFKNRQ
jgi:hypothetical protein